jgi:transposase-like protein
MKRGGGPPPPLQLQSGFATEPDHRDVKRRVRPLLGFKSADSAHVILSGIEMVHMMRKGQAKCACHSNLSLAEQFERLAA